MNDVEINSKYKNCGSTEKLFRVTILSPYREHSHNEIYCNEHTSSVVREFPEDIDLVEKIKLHIY